MNKRFKNKDYILCFKLIKKNFFFFLKNRIIKYIIIFIFFIWANKYKKENIKIRSKNKYKIIGISYSNEEYIAQLNLNKKSALEIGKVDKYYEYSPNDIDNEFKEKNKNILIRKRGNGYWLWKPYFMLKTLKEKLNDGDYLIYTDACILYKDNVKILVNFLIHFYIFL